jgi:UDP-2,4-diacetamido-2,4,6-trideoxy-beta-L-altropyranose hydrolase
MRIFFRVEASQKIGLGHLIRSISIANTIKNTYTNTEIIFLTGDYMYSTSKIKENEFEYITPSDQNEENFLLSNCINKNADILFIDKLYNYSTDFILKLTKHCKVIMFHNICDGAHLCDAFILPAAHIGTNILDDSRWSNDKVNFYEGMEYVVLNDKIINLRKSKISGTDVITLVLTTGGSDPAGVMLKVLNWINQIELPDITVYALIGESFVHTEAIESLKKELKRNIIVTPYNASYFKDANIAISTFGVSTYELIYLGLVVVSIGHCEQNALGSRILSEKCDQLIDLGNIENLSKEEFSMGLSCAIDKIRKEDITLCSIDGKGTSRVAEIILNIGKET